MRCLSTRVISKAMWSDMPRCDNVVALHAHGLLVDTESGVLWPLEGTSMNLWNLGSTVSSSTWLKSPTTIMIVSVSALNWLFTIAYRTLNANLALGCYGKQTATIKMTEHFLGMSNSLYFTALYSRSGKCLDNVCCNALGAVYVNTHSTAFLLTGCCRQYTERPVLAQWTPSGTLLSGQVSVKVVRQLSMRHAITLSHISSILLTGDLKFVRKTLGRAGLYGLACSCSF